MAVTAMCGLASSISCLSLTAKVELVLASTYRVADGGRYRGVRPLLPPEMPQSPPAHGEKPTLPLGVAGGGGSPKRTFLADYPSYCKNSKSFTRFRVHVSPSRSDINQNAHQSTAQQHSTSVSW
eukprot:TRINITY_DN9485_c0_g2_i1.p1 TRINITY_DN9485_c0_g2~~TRINITY_DN9485_c0_g2_i1.p1  ORF type:complete len:124 (-),score=10.01 TRINITY_DN9485_c0_g2_i1:17-388(-)